MDYSTLIARAKRLLIDTHAELDLELPFYLRAAQQRAEDDYAWEGTRASITLTLDSGAADPRVPVEAKPADWNGKLDQPYVLEGDGTTTPIEWNQDAVDLVTQFQELTIGRPRYLFETEGGWFVLPGADGLAAKGSLFSDGEYRIVVGYKKRLTQLGPASPFVTTNWFSENLGEYLLYETVADGFEFFWEDAGKAEKWRLRAGLEYRRAKSRDKAKRLPRRFDLYPKRNVLAPRRRF